MSLHFHSKTPIGTDCFSANTSKFGQSWLFPAGFWVVAEGRDVCWQLGSLLLCSLSQLLSAAAASTHSELNHFNFWPGKNRKGAKKKTKNEIMLRCEGSRRSGWWAHGWCWAWCSRQGLHSWNPGREDDVREVLFSPFAWTLIFSFFLATKGIICLILQNVTEAVGSGAAAHVFLINECVYSWKEVKMGLCYIWYLLKHWGYFEYRMCSERD